ncbi:MAG: hypothetical protein AAFN42_20745 [Cyanobacteria bacterium J06554_1]
MSHSISQDREVLSPKLSVLAALSPCPRCDPANVVKGSKEETFIYINKKSPHPSSEKDMETFMAFVIEIRKNRVRG